MKRIKCFLIGDESVGKCSLAYTYAMGTFPDSEIVHTISVHEIDVWCGGTPINLSVWVSMGNFEKLRPLTYVQTDIFIICYDVGKESSFQHALQKWLPEVGQIENTHCILCGLKSDVQHQRQDVSSVNVPFIECSAQNGHNVKEVFDLALRTAFGFSAEDETEGGCCLVH